MKRPQQPTATARLQTVPGTRVQLWTVDHCPWCGQTHYHSAGSWRDDPAARLGQVAAPCRPGRGYVLAQAPKPRKEQSKQQAKQQRRAERRQGKRLQRDSEEWED